MNSRVSEDISIEGLLEYFPLHYPEKAPLLGRYFRTCNTRRLSREIKYLLAPHGSQQRIVCFDSPAQYSLVGTLNEDMSIYIAIDDRTVTVTGDPIPGEVESEQKLLARVKRVICVSERLADTLRSRAGNRNELMIDVLSNGFDRDLFSPDRAWEEPPQLVSVPHPRILISGHISERIDWDGIRRGASLRPLWSWVFLGDADPGINERIGRIQSETGSSFFHFASVPHEDVPAWIRHCDVCAVPYRLNSFTLASSPLKAIEYLGAGAPVLSTMIPALQPFGHVIQWVTVGDGESYARTLDSITHSEQSREAIERRVAAVQSEGWDQKRADLSRILGLN